MEPISFLNEVMVEAGDLLRFDKVLKKRRTISLNETMYKFRTLYRASKVNGWGF